MSDDEEKPVAGGRGTLSERVAGHRLIRDMQNSDEWLVSDTTVLDLFGEFEQADSA